MSAYAKYPSFAEQPVRTHQHHHPHQQTGRIPTASDDPKEGACLWYSVESLLDAFAFCLTVPHSIYP
jgi:hypothetical protein